MPVPPPLALRQLGPTDVPACEQVLASLPTFFADPDGIADCARCLRTQPGYVALGARGEVTGFLTAGRPFADSAEITWLAVAAGQRRRGYGRALVEQAVADAAADGAALVCVTTLGPSTPEPGVSDGYAGTRAFYTRLGFRHVREWQPRDWNEGTMLLMVRPLGEARPADVPSAVIARGHRRST